MKYEIKTISPAETTVLFFPEPDQVKVGREASAKELSKHVKIPGFRPGKMPLSMVMQRYGAEIDESYAERVIFENLPDVIKEKNWLVLEPGIYIEKHETTQRWVHPDGHIQVRVDVLPDIKLKTPKIKLEDEVVQVEESEVDKEIEALRFRTADVKPVIENRPAQPQDILLLKEIRGKEIKGKEIKGKELKDAVGNLETHSDKTSSDEDDKSLFRHEILPAEGDRKDDFLGIRVGEIRQIDFETGTPSKAGESPLKVARKFLCKEIAVRVLPDVNDEFCKKLGPIESVEALRGTIRKELTQQKIKRIYDKNRALIVKEMVEVNDKVAVPAGVENRVLNEQIQSVVHSLSMMNMPEEGIKDYLDKYKDEVLKEAQKRAKFLVISSVYARDMGITVASQEVEKTWRNLNSNGKATDQVLEDSKRVRLKHMILEEKVVDALKAACQA